jgi:small subunit ribosomal protein S12
MSTLRQLVTRNIKFSKRIRPLVPALKKCPQKRGVVQKLFIQTPKKPNSAKRKVAKVKLSTGRMISCYVPGIGHKLTKHSVLLVRGGRAQDLIGVRYKPIFGKFDFVAPSNRVSRFSKFGLSRKQFMLSTGSDNETSVEPASDAIEGRAKPKGGATRHPARPHRSRTTSTRIDVSIYSDIAKYLMDRA